MNTEDKVTPDVIDCAILGMAQSGLEPPYMLCLPTLDLLTPEVEIDRVPPAPTPDPEYVCVARYGHQIYIAIPYAELMQRMAEQQ
jgi:hypothetical protein